MNTSYLPFWIGGLLLTSVPILHWMLLGRTMAVSGRFSSIVDRMRHGAAEPAPDTDALLAAIRAATEQAFAAGATEDIARMNSASMNGATATTPALAADESVTTHTSFLVGLVLGGVVSRLLSRGAPTLTSTLAGPLFSRMLGHGAFGYVALFVGGNCIGFGTRMAGGCTSGHGLCGLSQRQMGSLVATCAFFGSAVATSFALEAL